MNFGHVSPSSIYAQSQVSSGLSPNSSGIGNHPILSAPNENDYVSMPIQNGGLFTKEECKNLAKSIIDSYDINGDGVCDTIEVAKWLVDCYRAMNKSFQPTATDIASYMQVVDKNRKGKISVSDLEAFILKYFYNSQRQ